MSEARVEILDRIAAALGPDPDPVEVPREYLRAGSGPAAGDPALVERFAERVSEYSATVHRVDGPGLTALLERLLDRDVVVAPGLARELSSEPSSMAAAARIDDGTSAASAVRDSIALTGCFAAIAESGTIVLDGGPLCGRRLITLVPDHHVCLVRPRQVVASVPDAIAALRPAAAEGRPLTFVSGPSATSDIELERVEGVHGPRRLEVVIVAA